MTYVTLIFETDTNEDCDTQYDWLHVAVASLEKALKDADSMDDLAAVFKSMIIGGQLSFPSFTHPTEEYRYDGHDN